MAAGLSPEQFAALKKRGGASLGPDLTAPWDRAGFFGRITFDYVRPLLRLGAKRPLQEADLQPIAVRDRPANTVRRIEAAWAGGEDGREGDADGLADGRQVQLIAAAFKQLHPQFILQGRQHGTDGGAAAVQLPGCRGHAAVAHNREEGLDL